MRNKSNLWVRVAPDENGKWLAKTNIYPDTVVPQETEFKCWHHTLGHIYGRIMSKALDGTSLYNVSINDFVVPVRLYYNKERWQNVTYKSYYVRAVWDKKAQTFITDSNIPGLHIEGKTYDEFWDRVDNSINEVVVTNCINKKNLYINQQIIASLFTPIFYYIDV